MPPVIGTRLTQTRILHERIRVFSGSKIGVEPTTLDRDRVPLAQVLDGQLLADPRVLGRQVREQDVLADRRPRARARHVRAAALARR